MTTAAPGNYLDLSGALVTSCRVTIGASGTWIADVTTATDDPIVGTPTAAGAVGVMLRLGDLVLAGAVMRDQAFAASRSVLVVGGAGGWGKTLAPQAYHNDAGIPRGLPVGDVAIAAGEVIDPAELAAATDILGNDFVREGAPAARVLEQLVGPGWWVDPIGITHIVPRPVGVPIASTFLIEHYERATGRLLASTETLSDWMPGAIVAGPQMPTPRQLTSVTIDARPDGELRVEALTAPATGAVADRLLTALRTLVASELAALRFMRLAEYSVVTCYTDGLGGVFVDAIPVGLALELPALVKCPVRPALGGSAVVLSPGASVGVMWIDGNPARPVVMLCDGSPALSVALSAVPDVVPPGAELGRVVRYGDQVQLAVAGALASGPLLQQATSAPNPISRVSA
jgi:hypothetical protein